ncbi:hypothetical protein GGI35DRAFT_11936 [Trichoderma velutinum]
MEAEAIQALYASLGLLTRPSARQVSARNCQGLNPKCAENTTWKRHSPVCYSSSQCVVFAQLQSISTWHPFTTTQAVRPPIPHRICRPMMPSTLSQSTKIRQSSSPSFPSPLTLFDSRVTVVASARGMRCSHATFKHRWQGRALLSETQLRKCGECNAGGRLWMSKSWYGQESAAPFGHPLHFSLCCYAYPPPPGSMRATCLRKVRMTSDW